jgi:hypothetical protein
MAFVQVVRSKALSREQYRAVRDQATGGKLLDGELFFVDGYQGEEVWSIDGWESREACDRGMEKWGPAMQAAGVSMDAFTLDEFEIDHLHLGDRERAAVT